MGEPGGIDPEFGEARQLWDEERQSDSDPREAEQEDRRKPQDIKPWWLGTGLADYESFGPKLAEYGAGDLVAIGQQMAGIAGREVDEQQAAELGVFFYLFGKMARWAEALEQGRAVSDDTLHDITVYSMMARRIRQTGRLG